MSDVISLSAYRKRKQLDRLDDAMRAVFAAMNNDPLLLLAVTRSGGEAIVSAPGALACDAAGRTVGES